MTEREANGLDDDDEDWDVEAAVERRVVQVMFTVPKTRLRVVNADVEGDGIGEGEPEPEASGEYGSGEYQ